ncbi:uncharacterized protein LOC135713038 [Ochlerotatus camptorhynchus]|uniref:uncharacterized protein LOC135713038 n=1 Tax=Ochlerotatus camptorhynchus TaxID=644619 RepID=UPI0031CE56C1
MDREAKKLELYLLLCQSATALLVSLINTTRNSSPEIQTAIKGRMLQLVKTLWEFVRDSADELEDLENTLEPSHAATDLHSAPRRIWHPSPPPQPQPQPQPTTPTVIPRLPHHSTFIDQRPATRFPVIQRLLLVLARVPNEEIFAQAAHPFADDPAFRQRLQHEMYQLRRMLGEDDPSLHFGEQTLLHRLDRMETSMRQIMQQLDALTASPQEG